MAKYKTLVDFSSSNPGSTEIANYYNDTDSSLRFYYTTQTAAKFFGYAPEEIQSELEARIAELDATCAFTLLADLEATFKIDYLQRCYKKRKNLFRERSEISMMKLARLFRSTGRSFQHGRSIIQNLRP